MSAPFEQEASSDLYALRAVTSVLRLRPDLRLKDGVPIWESDIPDQLQQYAEHYIAGRTGDSYPSPAEHALHVDAVMVAAATLAGALKRPALSADLPGKELLVELTDAYRAMRQEARIAPEATGDTSAADDLAAGRMTYLGTSLSDLILAARWHCASVERVVLAAQKFRDPKRDGDPDPVLRNFVKDVARAFHDGFEVSQTRSDEDAITVHVPADAWGPLGRGENVLSWWEAPHATADADGPFMALLRAFHDEARAAYDRRYGRSEPWPAITPADVQRILADAT